MDIQIAERLSGAIRNRFQRLDGAKQKSWWNICIDRPRSSDKQKALRLRVLNDERQFVIGIEQYLSANIVQSIPDSRMPESRTLTLLHISMHESVYGHLDMILSCLNGELRVRPVESDAELAKRLAHEIANDGNIYPFELACSIAMGAGLILKTDGPYPLAYYLPRRSMQALADIQKHEREKLHPLAAHQTQSQPHRAHQARPGDINYIDADSRQTDGSTWRSRDSQLFKFE